MKNKTAFVITGIVAILLTGILYFRIPRKIVEIDKFVFAYLDFYEEEISSSDTSKTAGKSEMYAIYKEDNPLPEVLREVRLFPTLKGLIPGKKTPKFPKGKWNVKVHISGSDKDGRGGIKAISIYESGYVVYEEKINSGKLMFLQGGKEKAMEIKEKLKKIGEEYAG